jgi:toxin-antitoxin system PIN domain toxin
MTLAGPGYLFDVNVWLSLALRHHAFHDQAAAAFVAASAERKVYFCWATRLGVLRLLTTESVFKPAGLKPMTNAEALAVLDGWTGSPVVGSLDEPPSVWTRWRTVANLTTASPKRWMDAYLAAVALDNGLQLVTTDRAFESYAGLDPVVLSERPTPAASTAAAPAPQPPPPGAGAATGE